MIEELNKTLEIIEFLNKHIKKEAISKKRLEEERVNLTDFIVLQQNIKKDLEKFNTIGKNKSKEILTLLASLNMDFHSTIWHLEQLHELIKKMIVCYGEEIYEEEES